MKVSAQVTNKVTGKENFGDSGHTSHEEKILRTLTELKVVLISFIKHKRYLKTKMIFKMDIQEIDMLRDIFLQITVSTHSANEPIDLSVTLEPARTVTEA